MKRERFLAHQSIHREITRTSPLAFAAELFALATTVHFSWRDRDLPRSPAASLTSPS